MVTGIMAGRLLVMPLVKKRSKPVCWLPRAATPASACQGSIEEVTNVGRLGFGESPARSTKPPLASRLPAVISWMAYPTQLRGSPSPCSSQVLDDSVIHTRRYLTGTGDSARLSVAVPPCPLLTVPDVNRFHWPSGFLLRGSCPSQ